MKINISLVFLVGLCITIGLIICIAITLKKGKSFYKSNTKVSVIILSHNRSHNLKKSIPILLKYKNIDEIIVLHSNDKHFIKHKQKKVKDVKDYENNKKFFTLRRFLHTEKCNNNTVLLLDDDIIPSKQLLLKMLSEYDRNPVNCYGVISRLCDSSGYHSLVMNPNIVLTPILLSSKAVFTTVWKAMLEDKEKLQKVIQQKGNGEDILFQYFFQKIYEIKPIIITGNYKNLDTSNGFSTRHPYEHYKVRNNFCKELFK